MISLIENSQTKAEIKPRDFLPGYNLIEYLLLRGVTTLINILPVYFSYWIAKKVGVFLFLILPKRRKIALANLDIAFKDSKSQAQKEAIAKESFRNLVTSLLEFFNIPKFLQKSEQHFRFEGIEHLDKAFTKGKGIILVISHLGSWEYLEFLFYLKGYPCSVVGRSVKNPYIYQWIQSLRKATTVNHIDRRGAAKKILRELKKNHVVAILIDQWAGPEGLWVDFFGESTSTTSLPVRLARRTGAALIPAYCLRTAYGKYDIQVKPEVSFSKDRENWEEAMTFELNRLLEEQIMSYPTQWLWTHKRWKGLAYYQALKTK